ncbi:MAG: VTT domain-containing protein [Coxiellaceae bacterium]|jgi:membrane protein DedA with SNARE-associated domain/membrane-associated phospholipid phosphatase|nr:VTT domain-containing protein [Coxiellaceae bacterium]
MLNFHDINIHTIADFFSTHPYSLSIFAYSVVFVESMAIIGVIVPGAIIMPSIGFLIGSGVTPVGSTFMWTILGAITGDCLSYFIGIYFRDRIHKIWPFTRWPNLLSRSKDFFDEHGGKSVFIGRFIGPTRAMIPMIAGILKMPFGKFILMALPSAMIWIFSYMFPGILLGALSLELPPKIATMFAVGALLAVVIFWAAIWVTKYFLKQIWKLISSYIRSFWEYCVQHNFLSWLVRLLSDPKELNNHQQLTLLIGAILSFLLFGWIFYQALIDGFLAELGRSIYFLLKSSRQEVLDYIFVLITLLGDLPLLLVLSIIIFIWLWWKKYQYIALHWLSIIIFSGILIGSIKLLVYLPRPQDTAYIINSSSFPSAHVTLSVALYGFLAMIVAHRLKSTKRSLLYGITGFFLVSIAFSRIYLGAHWLIDVIGGIFLGFFILLLVTISYRRRRTSCLNTNKFILMISSVLIVLSISYSIVEFDRKMKGYSLVWPKQSIEFSQLIHEKMPSLPLYRQNRFGHPIEILNVVYIGELVKLNNFLINHGWCAQNTILNFQDILRSLFTTSVVHHLSILPQLYHNKSPAFLYTKNTELNDVIIILSLWPSDINLKNSNLSLWIGTIEYHHMSAYSFSLKSFKEKRSFNGVINSLAKFLEKDFCLWIKKYPCIKQSSEIDKLQWDRKILIIKSNN